MRIVQPVTAYDGSAGWVVYMDTGVPLAFIQQRDPMPRLRDVIGDHVLLGLAASITVTQYRRWAHQMPGSEGLTHADR